MSYDPGGPVRPDSRARRRAPRRGIGAAATMGIVLFGAFALFGAAGAVFAVSTYNSLLTGLPEPETLEDIALPEQSIVYDRTGQIELARFGEFNRQVVAFEDVPPVLVDATTAIEDRTFWDNAGFDPVGIVAAGVDALRGRPRGASTITQQLVRQRLLSVDGEPVTEVTASRKLKEIIQSIRVTQEFPGPEGKQRIMAAYLNQNYYGNESYGVASAAQGYFGVPLSELTLAQAAIIAALPQSPSTYDLVANAVYECVDPAADEETCEETQLVVPEDSRIVQRRNEVLAAMQRDGGTPLTKDEYSDADFEAAMAEPVILAPQRSNQWLVPQFVWQVRKELTTRLCGVDIETCIDVEAGGLTVISTLDMRLQGLAEKWVKAATIVPRADNPRQAARQLGLEYEPWMANLRDKTLRNGALIAMDYVTGEIVAYQGSADQTATKGTRRFQPRFDVLSLGWRQPGSAFKPIVYATGIDDRAITAASMFMDVVTDFGDGYTPTDADNLERGPVRVRNALQFSLNIPAVKALVVTGNDNVQETAEAMGVQFMDGQVDAGAAFALGVEEVHPKDLIRAYGVMANGGELVYQTTIIDATDDTGTTVFPEGSVPEPVQALDRGSAGIVTDILAGNTDPDVNPFWGQFAINDGGRRRPATLKTGTNNDARDLNAYGYIAAPGRGERADGEYALAVGAWNGNSDNSLVSTAADPLFSIDVTTHVWEGFLEEATEGWSINQFRVPDSLQTASVDPWTGLRSGSGRSVTELFLDGTIPQPGDPNACGEEVLQVAGFESDFPEWMAANRGWMDRAERGVGRAGGPENTRTAYFYNGLFTPYGRSWGAIVGGNGCGEESPTPSVDPCASPDPSASVDPSAAPPCPSPSESPSLEVPTEAPTEAPTEEPTPEPTEEPTPEPTEEPTPEPEPTEEPTPEPTAEAESPAP